MKKARRNENEDKLPAGDTMGETFSVSSCSMFVIDQARQSFSAGSSRWWHASMYPEAALIEEVTVGHRRVSRKEVKELVTYHFDLNFVFDDFNYNCNLISSDFKYINRFLSHCMRTIEFARFTRVVVHFKRSLI